MFDDVQNFIFLFWAVRRGELTTFNIIFTVYEKPLWFFEKEGILRMFVNSLCVQSKLFWTHYASSELGSFGAVIRNRIRHCLSNYVNANGIWLIQNIVCLICNPATIFAIFQFIGLITRFFWHVLLQNTLFEHSKRPFFSFWHNAMDTYKLIFLILQTASLESHNLKKKKKGFSAALQDIYSFNILTTNVPLFCSKFFFLNLYFVQMLWRKWEHDLAGFCQHHFFQLIEGVFFFFSRLLVRKEQNHTHFCISAFPNSFPGTLFKDVWC